MKLPEIPKVEHFAIFTRNTRTIYHEGDERSRINPGHGYPAYNETIESLNYEVFDTKEKLIERIKQLHKNNQTYRVMKITPMDVDVSVNVSLTKEK